jgi:hypothetical protein
MFGTSMLLTVGAAVDRAREEGSVVRLNIGGEWVTGRVLNSDGHGVAILESSGDLCVVRQEAVQAVRMPSVETDARVPSQGEYAGDSTRPRGEFVASAAAVSEFVAVG